MEDCTTSNIANCIDICGREDALFVVVGPVTCLLQESWWKTVSIGPVVGQFRVDVVVNLDRHGEK